MTTPRPAGGERVCRVRARHTLAVVAVAAALGLGACGLPEDGSATTVPPQDVPYGLLVTPTATPTTETSPAVAARLGTIYLVDAQQRLVPVPVPVPPAERVPFLQTLLNRLAVGPSERERARGLLTDLGPGASLSVQSISGGTARIELRSTDPSPGKLPVAIGQVVLTATAVQGVDRVLFTLDGAPLSVPGPAAGDLTGAALTASDYRAELAAGVRPPPPTPSLPDGSPDPTGR